MWKKVGLTFAALVGLLIVIGAVVFAANATLFTRLFTMSPDAGVNDLDWYDPVAQIAGGSGEPLPVASDEERSISAAALAEARDWAGQFGSVGLIVWHDGKIQLEHYWPGFGPESRIDTASMHKSVLAMLIGVAIGRGIIPSVDEPAATWIEPWREDERRNITIRHLLQMSAGLEPAGFSANPFAPGMQLFLGTHIDETVIALEAAEPPGQSFRYSNAVSQLLGYVLETAAGRPYEELLEDWLWSKLGARDALVWLDRADGMPRTYCCLLATAGDWLRVGLMILNDGRVGGEQVIPADWLAEMIRPAPTNPNYGYQLWLGSPHAPARRYAPDGPLAIPAKQPFARDDVVFFDGFGGQRVYVIPSEGMVIVRVGMQDLAWDDSHLPNLLIEGILPPPPIEVEPVPALPVPARVIDEVTP